METSPPRPADSPPVPVSRPWTLPSWLLPSLAPDARFARAYEALGAERRALLKGLIADHFALSPPAAALRTRCTREQVSGLSCRSVSTPRPFVLLLTDASLDAPALLLAALMPALSSGAADVLVLRLGARSGLPDVLLTACELAGQERVAAVSPALAARLLLDCAGSGQPGLVLYPDTPSLRRLVQRPGLRAALDASDLRLLPLKPPRALGLWRDAAGQFEPGRLGLLYGEHGFATGGVQPGRRSRKAPDDTAFAAFAVQPHDLLLVPDARCNTCQTAARLVVGESRLGLWTWPELSAPDVFVVTCQTFSSVTAPALL